MYDMRLISAKVRMVVSLGAILILGACGNRGVRQVDTDMAATTARTVPTIPSTDIGDIATPVKSPPTKEANTSESAGHPDFQLPDPSATVFFSPGSATLDMEDYAVIDAAAKKLDNVRSRVLLIGHTDNLASNEYCIALSAKRISVVEAELLKRGIRATQIRKRLLGKESSFLKGCGSKPCRQAGRSVEFKFSQ